MANRIVLNPVSYHGAGAVKEIGGELSRRGYKRAFIACGRHVVKSGEINKITDVLDEIGVAHTFYTDIKPNPTIENVQNGVKAFQDFGADCIIAVGGGSVMDTSKAIGIIVNNPEFADVSALSRVSRLPRSMPSSPLRSRRLPVRPPRLPSTTSSPTWRRSASSSAWMSTTFRKSPWSTPR